MRIKAEDPALITLVGEFLKTYLPYVRHRDEDTISSYRHSINLYIDYLGQACRISLRTLKASDFRQANITGFMSWLADSRGNVAPTVNHRLSDIRSFCRFLAKKGAISQTDYEEIREITDAKDNRVIDFEWLSVEEVRLILEQVEGNREHLRDSFLLSLLYESGARINEVLSLRLNDFKPTSSGEVDVHFYGKGSKHRITPLSSRLMKKYDEYVSKYHTEKDPEALVFYTSHNGRKNKMSSDNVSRILKDCEASIRETHPDIIHLHSHLFRRSRAMHLYQAGVPLPTVSEWLGHSNIETTRFYAKVTDEMKRDALSKLSESDKSVFKDDVAFKYADDEDALRRLSGLK